MTWCDSHSISPRKGIETLLKNAAGARRGPLAIKGGWIQVNVSFSYLKREGIEARSEEMYMFCEINWTLKENATTSQL